eukprot:751072-Hanusia_phi.AAC.4
MSSSKEKFVGKDVQPKVGMRVSMATPFRQHGIGTIFEIGSNDVSGEEAVLRIPVLMVWDGGRIDRIITSATKPGELTLVESQQDGSTYIRTRSHSEEEFESIMTNDTLSYLAEELQDDLERVEEKTSLLRAIETEVISRSVADVS